MNDPLRPSSIYNSCEVMIAPLLSIDLLIIREIEVLVAPLNYGWLGACGTVATLRYPIGE